MYWLSIFICIGVCDCTLLAACFILLPGSGGGQWWGPAWETCGPHSRQRSANLFQPFFSFPSMLCLLVSFVSYILNSLQGCKSCPTLILTFLGPSLHVISGKKDLALHCLIFSSSATCKNNHHVFQMFLTSYKVLDISSLPI